MSALAPIAMGFAIFRGFMLAALTVPWLVQKVKRPDAAEPERALAWMVGSRSILFGVAIMLLTISSRREAVAWALLGDGVLQLFDASMALAQRKRTLAVLPAILCLLDVGAGIALMLR